MEYALLGSLVWYSALMALVLLELGDVMMKVVGASLMMTFEDHGLREPLSKSPLTSRSPDVVQIVEVSSADVLVDVEVPDAERRLREDEE